jgi:hypothetical protein
MAVEGMEAINAPDEQMPNLKRWSDFADVCDEATLKECAKGALIELNQQRKAAGQDEITKNEFSLLIKPFCLKHDLFPCTENFAYAYKRAKERLEAVEERYMPAPSSQELLKQRYHQIESETPPEGLTQQQRTIWERKQLQRLVEIESAITIDSIANSVGVYVNEEERTELWNRTRGQVVNKVTILNLLKTVCQLSVAQVKAVDEALAECQKATRYVGVGGYTDESGKTIRVI